MTVSTFRAKSRRLAATIRFFCWSSSICRWAAEMKTSTGRPRLDLFLQLARGPEVVPEGQARARRLEAPAQLLHRVLHADGHGKEDLLSAGRRRRPAEDQYRHRRADVASGTCHPSLCTQGTVAGPGRRSQAQPSDCRRPVQNVGADIMPVQGEGISLPRAARDRSSPAPRRGHGPARPGIARWRRPGPERAREAAARGRVEGLVELPELGHELPGPGRQPHPSTRAAARRPSRNLNPAAASRSRR